MLMQKYNHQVQFGVVLMEVQEVGVGELLILLLEMELQDKDMQVQWVEIIQHLMERELVEVEEQLLLVQVGQVEQDQMEVMD